MDIDDLFQDTSSGNTVSAPSTQVCWPTVYYIDQLCNVYALGFVTTGNREWKSAPIDMQRGGTAEANSLR